MGEPGPFCQYAPRAIGATPRWSLVGRRGSVDGAGDAMAKACRLRERWRDGSRGPDAAFRRARKPGSSDGASVTTLPTFEVFADPDWAKLFVDATQITPTLVSSTKYTVSDGQGGLLTITGTGFTTQLFAGYQVLDSGAITGFNITVGHNSTEIAFGKGYPFASSDVYSAIFNYVVLDDKTALIDLWFSVQVEVVGTAAHVAANLPQLETYATNVAAIKLTSGELTVSIADFTTYKTILDAVVGGFVVADTSAHVATAFGALAADIAQVKSITFTGHGEHTLTLSAAVATADAALVKKIAGAFVIEIHDKDGAWTTKGHGDHLTIHAYKGGDTITGGGHNETFVFTTGFGHAAVTDFASHLKGSIHDVLDWSAFTSLGEALRRSREHNGDLVITDAKGDTLTLDDVTKPMLTAAQKSDFKWG
jgi:hypothetical protein